MNLSERKLKILQAIISDFIKTAEPVGSRTLSKKFDLGISPATIRNEMADLEEMGYLTHPHTSAGRVPSEMAYRLYVNEMMGKSELSDEVKTAISNELYDNVMELEKTVQHAAKILSDITNLTSFAMTPTKERDTLKYINLLPVDETTVVLMIVSDSGKVSNTAVQLDRPVAEETLRILAKSMTYNYSGKTLSEALKIDIIRNFNSLRLALESRDRISVAHVCMDKMSKTVYGRICKAVSACSTAFFINALENAHIVSKISVAECDHAADSRCEVWSIRLKISCFKSLCKSLTFVYEVIDSVCLVAVCSDELIFIISHCCINDKRRVFNFALIKRLCKNSTVFNSKNSVSAVCTSAHNKICDRSLFTVCCFADHDAASYI